MRTIAAEHFTEALRGMLDETFENVRGYYLDRGTSLFETLSDITAEEASIPVGGKCATLAAQVKHVAFYLEVLEHNVRRTRFEPADWSEIWRTVSTVTPEEWEAIKEELRTSYAKITDLVQEQESWSSPMEIGGAMAMVAHTAYHLGEIRQALCTLRT